jgi:hypothetical protein
MAVPEVNANEIEHRRQLARGVNTVIAGKLNATVDVTLTPSATATTVTDARFTGNSFVGFCPLTASALAALGALYMSAQGRGTATLTHAANAASDQLFRLLIVG